MISRRLIPVFALLVCCAAIAAQPQPTIADDLTISPAWARATPVGTNVGAVYFSIENRGSQLDTLLRVTSPIAGEAMFHRTMGHDGVVHMEQLWTIDLATGRTVKFEPNGRHVMLHDLKQALVAGTTVPITLHFQHAGAVTLQVRVVPISATGPAASGN
jgi:copper(I)-binding protein